MLEQVNCGRAIYKDRARVYDSTVEGDVKSRAAPHRKAGKVVFKGMLQTDQTVCYTEAGTPVDCDGTGQDGAFGDPAGPPPADRFRVRGHVVEDEQAGAVWLRDANPAGFPLTWKEAGEFVADMRDNRAHGYDRWQLPSRRLLFSLISHQRVNPALPEKYPFSGVFNGYYWTADTCLRLPDQAWYIHLGGGRIHRGMKHGSYLAWPVSPGRRSTPDIPVREAGGRFVADGVSAYDTQTGRVWSKDANPFGQRLTWPEALGAMQAFNEQRPGGLDDWRLPNVRELESLVDLGSHSPALPDPNPFVNVQDAYWSSTTSVYEPRYAWTLYSQDGYVGVGFKSQKGCFVWPVSNG